MVATRMSTLMLVSTSFLLLTGLACAVTPSGLGYVGVHTAGQQHFDETLSVAISPDESILATGTEGYVVITSMETRQVLKIINAEDDATVLEFSPDGDYLVVGLKSDSPQTRALQMYSTSDWSEYGDGFNNGKNPQDISFSADGAKILVQGQNKDAFELSFPDLEVIGHLENLHTDILQCSDYGSGGSIAITGGLDGMVALWNMSEHSLVSSMEIEDSEIVDCLISPDSLSYSVLINNGYLRTFWLNGTMVDDSEKYFIEAKQIKWSDDGDHIFVLESYLLPSLQRLRATDWVIDEITNFGHQVGVFDITTDAKTIVTSTGTIHVGIYQSNFKAQGHGEDGPDFDGDGIPDSLDEDDDGDGINDIYDVSCSTDIDCAKSADSEYIRSIEFKIETQSLIISDSVTFNRYDSNALRNLTTSLLSDDNRIDVDELTWMSIAMCDNIIERDVVDQWQTLIEIEGAQLTNGSLTCDPIEGISSNDFGDHSLRATFTWVTKFDLSSTPLAPYNFTIKGIAEASTGSSALIAPQFPVSLVFTNSMATDSSIALWNKGDGARVIFMDEVPATGPGVDDLVIAFIMANLWIPIGSILGILGGVALIVKQNKTISFALLTSSGESLDEDADDAEEDADDSYDDYEEYDEYEDSIVEGEDDVWTQESELSPPKPSRGPPRSSTQRAAKIPYHLDADEPVKARRRRVSDKQPTGSKRKTLVESADDEEEYDYGLDGVYHDAAWETEYDEFEPPKVRKVKKAEEEMEEPAEKSKGRRKVKRRNPKKSKKKATPDKEVVAKKVVASKKRIRKSPEPTKSEPAEPPDDEDSAMDKALGMLTGSKDD